MPAESLEYRAASDGEAGDDGLYPGAGDDLAAGGAGTDFAIFAGSPLPVTVDLVAGTAIGEGIDSLPDIENVGGTEHPDVIRGDESANYLEGNGANDKLVGRGGPDKLSGSGGDDTIRPGGTTAVVVHGGEGFDHVTFDDVTAGVSVDIGALHAAGKWFLNGKAVRLTTRRHPAWLVSYRPHGGARRQRPPDRARRQRHLQRRHRHV